MLPSRPQTSWPQCTREARASLWGSGSLTGSMVTRSSCRAPPLCVLSRSSIRPHPCSLPRRSTHVADSSHCRTYAPIIVPALTPPFLGTPLLLRSWARPYSSVLGLARTSLLFTPTSSTRTRPPFTVVVASSQASSPHRAILIALCAATAAAVSSGCAAACPSAPSCI